MYEAGVSHSDFPGQGKSGLLETVRHPYSYEGPLIEDQLQAHLPNTRSGSCIRPSSRGPIIMI